MRLAACLCCLTDVYLIIRQGVTNEVELERAESLGKLLHCHRVACKKKKRFNVLKTSECLEILQNTTNQYIIFNGA